MPVMNATVPPETPGMMSAVPIASPFPKRVRASLADFGPGALFQACDQVNSTSDSVLGSGIRSNEELRLRYLIEMILIVFLQHRVDFISKGRILHLLSQLPAEGT